MADTELSAAHTALVETVPAGAGSRIVDEPVDYELDGVRLEGYLAHDEAIDGPKPAVLVVHDWTGLGEYPTARAQMLARLGYVGFAIDVYGYDADGTPIRPGHDRAAEVAGRYYGDPDLLRARVRAAYDVAVADPRIDSTRIVIAGYCFGGHAALEFARTDAELRGVAAFHPSLAPHEPAEVDQLPPVQLYLGGADSVTPDAAIVAFEDELRTRPELDWQTSVYSGAPHAFTLPEGPYDERADRRSWRQFTDFLDEVLGAVHPS